MGLFGRGVSKVSSDLNYFQGRLDRLSALIERIDVQAQVAFAHEKTIRPANFFLYSRNLDTQLIYLPRENVEVASREAKAFADYGAELVFAADITITGPGKDVILSLPDLVKVDLVNEPALKAILEPLVEEVQKPRCGGEAVFQRLCEVVIIRLLRVALESTGSQSGLLAGLSHPRLAHAIVAMHDRLDEAWSLDSLASVAGMSRTQFAVVFKEVVGMTPISYLTYWRLEVSKVMLAEGKPVKIVARDCGFASPAAFSRAFSRQYGFPPKQLRNRDN